MQVRVEEDLKREIVSHSDAMDIVVREVREVKRRYLSCATAFDAGTGRASAIELMQLRSRMTTESEARRAVEEQLSIMRDGSSALQALSANRPPPPHAHAHTAERDVRCDRRCSGVHRGRTAADVHR